ncbi:M50 family metallopeptidase [Kamptonema cortianum]|nr:M50 family metallopeptidase [Geitlerinema splendidum]MDK3161199.1 M50 family metallopeptidase [Kamptonema cortianum]
MELQKHQRMLVFASLATIAIWMIPLFRPVLLPLVYFNTHLHELFHALTAMATGGVVKHILVFADGSGVTPVANGMIVPIASAGYIGTAVLGGLMIRGSKTAKLASRTFFALFVLMALSMVLFVRGDIVGVISGFAWTILLGMAAIRLKDDWAIFLGKFLGVQLCFTAFHSILALLSLTVSTPAATDAKLLEEHTFIPAILWATLWAVIALASVFLSLRSAWDDKRG